MSHLIDILAVMGGAASISCAHAMLALNSDPGVTHVGSKTPWDGWNDGWGAEMVSAGVEMVEEQLVLGAWHEWARGH